MASLHAKEIASLKEQMKKQDLRICECTELRRALEDTEEKLRQEKALNAELKHMLKEANALNVPGSPTSTPAEPYKHSRLVMVTKDVPSAVGNTQDLKLSGFFSWTFECWINISEINSRQ